LESTYFSKKGGTIDTFSLNEARGFEVRDFPRNSPGFL